MSKALFDILVSAARQRDTDIDNPEEGRFIQRLSEDDASLMAQADTSVLSLSRSQRMVRVAWGDDLYFVTFGIGEPDSIPQNLEYAELTPGIFVSSILAANIMPGQAVSGASIKDTIEGEYIGIQDYQGHHLNSIASLFPACQIYRVISSEPFTESNHRFLGVILSKSFTDGPLNLHPQTLQCFSDIFEAGSDFLPYENILQGLLSFSWSNLYLECYRCLEQLYALPKVSALTQSWNSPLALKDVVALLESHLSWRPKEDEALTSVVRELTEPSVQLLCGAFKQQYLTEEHIRSCETVASHVYKLRNSIVHFRPFHDTVSKSDGEWNDIVQAMLQAVNDIYSKLGKIFFQAPALPANASAITPATVPLQS
jgi:hypothetical protein